MSAQWTEERENKLRVLWLQGLSASQIAKQLGGVTRNAVIGKRIRMCLPDRANPNQGSNTQRKKRVAQPKPAPIAKPKYTEPSWKPAPPSRRPPLMSERPNAIRFIERASDQCAMFIDGEDGALGFVCGEPSKINQWCLECARLCYQPSEKKAAA